MLTSKELDLLYQIINLKDQTLDKISQRFIKNFGSENDSLFKPCYSISNLLFLNLLTKLQRLIAIFLLNQSYKTEGLKKNPFGFIILEIFQRTPEQYQRKFIAEIILDNRRDRYSKLKIDILTEQYQLYQQTYKNREEITVLKRFFTETYTKVSSKLNKLFAINPKVNTQIRNYIIDFNFNQLKNQPIDIPIKRQNIQESELAYKSYNVSFFKPLPKFIDISSDELIWISPSLISQVLWDNSQERFSRLCQILKKSEATPLTSQQAKDVLKILEQYPQFIQNIEISEKKLYEIIIKNPFIATEILIRLTTSSSLQKYIQSLANMELHINSLDVMLKCIERCNIQKRLIQNYIIKVMQKCTTMQATATVQHKFARIISSFIKSLIKKNSIDIREIDQYIKIFLLNFPKVPEVLTLNKLINQYL